MFNVGGVIIPVTDLKKSKLWYEENLGLTKVDEWNNDEELGAGYCFKRCDIPHIRPYHPQNIMFHSSRTPRVII
ncbi:hypothetical protein GCM10008986_31560 [Salinibacillus aidingensis]|uniref:Glyoxalase/fosfomycin resistance/dioxygenase domain-containing protein n=1 Tax=Salinibacillus aidingensis TaxID=237684 RepID=A0ABP3LIQ3_9BACI